MSKNSKNMATSFMCYITGKPARAVLWILVFIMLIQQVFPPVFSNSVRVWIVIKGRKFMYIVLNFIIISILISSSSYLTNIFLKVNKKTSKINQFYSQKSVSSSPLVDDGTWSFFTHLDYEQPPFESTTTVSTEEEKAVSLLRVVHEQEQPLKSSVAKEKSAPFCVLQEEEYSVEDYKSIVEGNEAKEESEIAGDSLDATWKAIMESQGKGTGPQLTKSDTWSCGDGDGEERRKEEGGMIGGLSKYRVQERLKKWHSYRDMVERRETGAGSSGGDGGKKRGWKSMEVALTFHDEFKKKADAFIARFTQDIRLQRLESDQRFMEMINRGV